MCIRWTHQPCRILRDERPAMTHFDYSVLKQQVMGFPECHLCHWPLFRDSDQDPGRAGWQHARSTSELSYHWHQVSWRCHVFILWEFNPPFRMDQALCRWCKTVQISVSGHTSPWECLENNLVWVIQVCFISDHEPINYTDTLCVLIAFKCTDKYPNGGVKCTLYSI